MKTTILKREATDICNARTLYGGYCESEAGLGTKHIGRGRCKFHGGASDGPPRKPHYLKKQYIAKIDKENTTIANILTKR